MVKWLHHFETHIHPFLLFYIEELICLIYFYRNTRIK